jgi:hypothetical protein
MIVATIELGATMVYTKQLLPDDCLARICCATARIDPLVRTRKECVEAADGLNTNPTLKV